MRDESKESSVGYAITIENSNWEEVTNILKEKNLYIKPTPNYIQQNMSNEELDRLLTNTSEALKSFSQKIFIGNLSEYPLKDTINRAALEQKQIVIIYMTIDSITYTGVGSC